MLVAADAGKKIKVRVSFTDDDGHAETVESDAYPSVDSVAGADTTAPAFDEAAVDGTELVITFDEALAAASKLANSAFEVNKGGVAQTLSGTPSIAGATVTLTLAAAVAQSDTVTVKYTRPDTDDNNRLEDASGNEVATFDTAEAVDNTTNAAAAGKPVITGTAQVGETLTAGTAGITDANGLAGAVFSYQWVRVGSDGVSDATDIGSDQDTYVLVAADAGKKIKVRVSFTDDDGHAETVESDAYPSVGSVAGADTTAPAFDEATVDGTELIITFDEALAAASKLANSAFEVNKGGVAQTLSGTPSIAGATVTLTLAAAVAQSDTVTVKYTRPDTDDNNRLEDASGATDPAGHGRQQPAGGSTRWRPSLRPRRWTTPPTRRRRASRPSRARRRWVRR